MEVIHFLTSVVMQQFQSVLCSLCACQSKLVWCRKETKNKKTIIHQQEKPKGARTTIPGSDGGKGGERCWRFTVGRCTTETVWGNCIFIHWTNYLWEWVRGISQHPLSVRGFLLCACPSLQV